MKTTKAIIGMAAAAAAGVAIGILIAPEKGSDLQKKILSGGHHWLDEISKLIEKEKRLVAQGERENENTAHELNHN